jgi:hypothetical protein
MAHRRAYLRGFAVEFNWNLLVRIRFRAGEPKNYLKCKIVGAKFIAPILLLHGRDESRPYAARQIWDSYQFPRPLRTSVAKPRVEKRFGYWHFGHHEESNDSNPQGNTSRALARVLKRDVKRVHEDVSVLMERGLIARTAAGKVHVPYDVIHAEFAMRAAA